MILPLRTNNAGICQSTMFSGFSCTVAIHALLAGGWVTRAAAGVMEATLSRIWNDK